MSGLSRRGLWWANERQTQRECKERLTFSSFSPSTLPFLLPAPLNSSRPARRPPAHDSSNHRRTPPPNGRLLRSTRRSKVCYQGRQCVSPIFPLPGPVSNTHFLSLLQLRKHTARLPYEHIQTGPPPTRRRRLKMPSGPSTQPTKSCMMTLTALYTTSTVHGLHHLPHHPSRPTRLVHHPPQSTSRLIPLPDNPFSTVERIIMVSSSPTPLLCSI